ncbi:PEP-CTERM sorting domain-containing protein [Rhodoferax koreense]|uniref:Npun_F0296 family exosortase-dependent surface protein n=1 Tax=Rhodoferax koreensis TaxID=1842727 RepID=UPI0012FFD2DA|nr:PEP-CTERM sorting domain-containing protein [Rhodoferax koreense]
MKKILFGSVMAMGLAASVPALAYSVSFDSTNTNVAGGDQSGKTSYLLGANNVAAAGSGLFVETFDARNGGGNAQGCGLDTPSNLVSIAGGTYGLRTGTVASVAAAPAGDKTCYAFGPTPGGALPDKVNINYSGLLATLGPGASLNYFGLYYGSIDTFNDLIFYNASGAVIATVTGSSLINQFKGTSGNQQADSSNIYVNLFFTPAEQFTSFAFSTSGVAFEMDNLAIGYNIARNVPEPASLALTGLALAAVVVTRRRKLIR